MRLRPPGADAEDPGGAEAPAVRQDPSADGRPARPPRGVVPGRRARSAGRLALHPQPRAGHQPGPAPARPHRRRRPHPEHPAIPEDVREFWRAYFTRSAFPWESDGWPFNSPTHHLESWWRHRDEPNVLLLHYQDMLDDLDGQMRRVSAFLDIPVDEDLWPELVEACTFSDMRADQHQIFGDGATGAVVSSFRFFHKGRSGQWHGVVTEEDLALYRAAMRRLPAGLRAWLPRDPG
ncbi:sulfotransferase domain-containing protein [Streptomyces sp. TRM 70361]|uniref:sulfotransferase domain-containing protein n=1 Tax=Streptomyces sp. TRM 70361 TaxID=3116553 RepID=UPI003FCE1D71